MACPTCDHTLQRIAEETAWCPRCGTLVDGNPEAPKLVERAALLVNHVREFTEYSITAPSYLVQSAVDCSESCQLPGDRWK